MDATALNSLVLGLLGLIVFFYVLHTTVRSAVRRGIQDARTNQSGTDESTALPDA
ncbi:hypothetical protein [Arthrobacter sp.]|uniref:hypothetical protein n=1 Tax=Arthrobacter sp. TaxID=1667 RepID=UPI003A91FD0F